MFDATSSDSIPESYAKTGCLPLILSPMTEEDLRRVMEIDRASFATPWSETTFLDEIRSPACRFFVARAAEGEKASPQRHRDPKTSPQRHRDPQRFAEEEQIEGGGPGKDEGGRMKIESKASHLTASPSHHLTHSHTHTLTVSSSHTFTVPPSSIVGFLGLWIAHREMHVTTIGVDPACRRRGVALQLMIHALEYGRGTEAERATLEVRRSNTGARKLYENLGFVVCGVRPGYYLDTGEDALLMWIHDLSAPETYIRLRRLREQRCIRT